MHLFATTSAERMLDQGKAAHAMAELASSRG
jgi:hypothetical protein